LFAADARGTIPPRPIAGGERSAACIPLRLRCSNGCSNRQNRKFGAGSWLFTPLIFHSARRAGLQDEDAADLVQDVFMVLVQKMPEFEYNRHKRFRSWLRTITLNKWRDRQRRRAARPRAAEFMDLVEFVTTGLHDPRATPQNLAQLIPLQLPSELPPLEFELDD
jgi:Sigma-70 region 2